MADRAFDLERHVVHLASTDALQNVAGETVAVLFDGLTWCGLSTATLKQDIEVGPDAFTFEECQACWE